MRKTFIGLLIVVATIAFFTGCEKAPKDTVAKVGKYTISVEELNETVAPLQVRWKTAQEAYDGRMSAVDNLVQQKLLLLGAYKEGLDKDTTALKRLEADEDRRKLYALWEAEIVDKIEVSEEALRERYDKLGIEYRASHILVRDSSLAWEIYDRAKGGEDFGELAMEYSEDPGSKDRGGDLSWFTVGRMVKEFEDAVLALKDGEISEPIRTQYGFHIIMRTGSRPRQQEPYEQAKENLKKTLENELQRERSMEFVDGIFEDAQFEINQDAVDMVVGVFQMAAEEAGEAGAPSYEFTEDQKAMTLATWNNGSWTVNELDSVLAQMPPFRRQNLSTAEELIQFVRANVQQELLLNVADNLKVTETEAYKEMYTKALDDMMLGIFQNQHIYDAAEVTEEEITAYYQANQDSFMQPRTISVVEVQLTDENEARGIADKVKAGEDIAKFVESSSIRTYTKRTGGALEITERRFPNLYAAVSGASVGDVVGPVKDRQNRWSVMKVQEITEPSIMPLERVRARIQGQLRREKREGALQDYLAQARKEFNVKIYGQTIAASVDSAHYGEKQTETKPAQPEPVSQ